MHSWSARLSCGRTIQVRRWRPCLAPPEMLSNEPAQLNQWAPERWPVADDWRAVVDHFVASETGRQLGQFIRDRLASGAVIYPPQPLRALALTALAQVK